MEDTESYNNSYFTRKKSQNFSVLFFGSALNGGNRNLGDPRSTDLLPYQSIFSPISSQRFNLHTNLFKPSKAQFQNQARKSQTLNPQFRKLRPFAPPMAKSEPEIIRDKTQMRKWSRATRAGGKVIALVPTMGYLHEGHISLINEAKKHSDVIVVSIYVNPGQFAPSEDLATYPSDFAGDLRKLAAVGGVAAVFHPHNLYDYGNVNLGGENGGGSGGGGGVMSCVEQGGFGHESWVRVEKLEKGMCGRSRPVFFRGVATVVAKLFNIVEPDVAVFGKKDYQQWRIIRRMVRDLDFAIEVMGTDIVRESDGLAMSSRNVRLSPQDREKALSINRALSRAKAAAERGQINCRELITSVTRAVSEAGGEVDYAEIVDQESLTAVDEVKSPVAFCVAAWFGKVRLIDNVEISS